MNYQKLNLIGIVLLCLCGLMLAISILLFIGLRMISVIGYLSGSTAKRQIEKLRSNNEESSLNKGINPYNRSRMKFTERITTGLIKSKHTSELTKTPQIAEVIRSSQLETEILAKNYTDTSCTELLSCGTELLDSDTVILGTDDIKYNNELTVKKSIILIHTSEVI